MADPNLTGALRGALDLLDGDSPLAEATPDAVDELLDRINAAMAAGLPGSITDSEFERVMNVYRAQAYKWAQEEQMPKERKPRGKAAKPQSIAEAVDIDLDL